MAFSPSDHKGVIIGKRGFLEADTVERFLVKPERRVRMLAAARKCRRNGGFKMLVAEFVRMPPAQREVD
jgi:hypothetical protein